MAPPVKPKSASASVPIGRSEGFQMAAQQPCNQPGSGVTFGQLLKTFVFQELRRQASWHEDEIRLHHFRDKDGAEVDIVLERGAHEVAGVEVKSAATVTTADFRGLCASSRKPRASASPPA